MMTHTHTRISARWLAGIAIATALSVGILVIYSPQLFEALNLKVSMKRREAAAQAEQLAHEHGLLPAQHHEAIMFEHDGDAQMFIELEGGGKKAFQELLHNKLYYPFTWKVRHYQEGNPEEHTLFFTPDGQPYGFVQVLSYTTPGTTISVQEAAALARYEAKQWNTNM